MYYMKFKAFYSINEFCKKIQSNSTFSTQKLETAFLRFKAIMHNDRSHSKDKVSAWRLQTILANCVSENFSNVLIENLWTDCSQFDDSNFEVDALYITAVDINSTLIFPTIKDSDYSPDQIESIEMFNDDVDSSGNFKPFDVKEYKKFKPYKPTGFNSCNITDNFLQRSFAKNVEPSFMSARQLLNVHDLKKNMPKNEGNVNFPFGEDREQREDIGLNFGATKKLLGSFGRVFNSNRKNFVSPVRTKSFDEEPTISRVDSKAATLISHPALKNVDTKMVELINNEIIYKFKPVDWKEISGLDYAKSIIKEAVVFPLLRPDIFTGLRRPPKGILLFGPPGTGKTLIGKCIASQSSSTFFSISASSLTSKWMGEGEKMVRALFAVAIARQPSVIFIDEVDSLLSRRSDNENEGTRRLKTEFLVRLDGAATSDEDRILIVGATNRPQELDEAVRRRFIKRLYVPLPEKDARAEILQNLLKTVENNLNLDQIKEISQLTEGYSGSDMDSLCREASMEPLRSLSADDMLIFRKDYLRPVNVRDFHLALKKIRPSVSQSDLIQYVEWNETYGTSC